MPRIFYEPSDDFLPLPEWIEDSRHGKSRKVSGAEGESMRLMKKRREEKMRRSRKEMARMRRYEESMKRKEKMVKDDRKRSTMADGSQKMLMSLRKAGEKGQKAATNDNMIRDAGKRCQLGDGCRRDLHKAGGAGRSKCGRKNLTRRHRDARKERVAIEVERVRGKQKVEEWMAKVDMANPSVTNVQDVSSVSQINDTERSVDDTLPPWPISRYCLEDPDFKIKIHCRTSNPSDCQALGEQRVNLLYSLFGRPTPNTRNRASVDPIDPVGKRRTPGVKYQKRDSLRARFSSALHRLAGYRGPILTPLHRR